MSITLKKQIFLYDQVCARLYGSYQAAEKDAPEQFFLDLWDLIADVVDSNNEYIKEYFPESYPDIEGFNIAFERRRPGLMNIMISWNIDNSLFTDEIGFCEVDKNCEVGMEAWEDFF